ncbi:hypothetical protein TWF696_002205 [Orbilia brochopaga]|uniref:Uncharacterized protein n=1 Tax=Orbilia brochopaga TaxID=3140254 RepID=A0AAV9U7I0_9PEZI
MPPKPKAKPKPQLRKTAAAAAAAAAADSEALLAPKEEPQAEDTAAPAPQPQPQPQPTSYQSASLFLEDHSDTDSDAPAQAPTAPPPESEPPAVPATVPEDSEDEDDAAFSDLDDDPVVQSYDIIVNNTFEDMMYLFQYPVRSKTQPYTLQEGFAPVEARMKVDTGVLELDIPINIERNYDEHKGVLYGEALHKSRVQRSLRGGVAIDGMAEGSSSSDRRKRRRTGDGEDDDDSGIPTPEHLMDFDEAKRKNRILNRQTLGAKMQENDANYFVGLFEDGKLHFTRLKGTLQLRPQFHHIDIMTEQERASQKAMRDMNNPNPAKPVEARAVNLSVKAASGDSRTLTAAEQLSKDIRQEEDEVWREIEWVDQDDDEAWQMFANVHKQQPVPLNNVLTKAEYFKWCSAPAGLSDEPDDGRGHRHSRSGR